MRCRWMNGQHLRLLPTEEVASMFGEQWVKAGFISKPAGPFVNVSTKIGNFWLITDAVA